MPVGATRGDRKISFSWRAFHADQHGATAGDIDGFHGEDAEAAAEELGHCRVPGDSLLRIMRLTESGTQRESSAVHGGDFKPLRLPGLAWPGLLKHRKSDDCVCQPQFLSVLEYYEGSAPLSRTIFV
jgi:hypothetical protein